MSRQADEPTFQEILSAVREAANMENAVPMAAYMKGIAPFFGIKKPDLRVMEHSIFAVTKTLSFPEVEMLIRRLYGQPERELHYLAMDWLHSRRKQWTETTITLIEHLIIHHSWWDTVDFLAKHCLGEWVRRYPGEGLKTVCRYIGSGNLWLERSAILHQLSYKDATDAALLSDCILPHIRSKEFFHQKAIGWALREYAYTDAEWVRTFVDAHPLMPLSKREALKHL